MSDTINKREFVRHAGKYLIPDKTYILKGNPDIIVRIELSDKKQVSDKNLSDKPMSDNIIPKMSDTTQKRIDKVLTTVPGMATAAKRPFIPNWQQDHSKYGCGCKKIEGQTLCTKHGRR